MTTAAARDHGLGRLSDLTTWLAVGAVGATGVFAGLAARATHTSTAATSGQAASSSSGVAAGGLSTAQVPTASAGSSHVRSGSS